ncbi:MAG: SIR2 family NAD-dependent protein deacylase, partial [Actinomycetota bacterium]
SGIPDFRGPEGVWTKDPAAEKLSHIDAYLASREVRAEVWRRRLNHPAWTALPNGAHLGLAALEQKGGLQALVTQNIDGMHQKAGTSPEILIEIHGTIHEVVCLACGERTPSEPTLARVRAGDEDPSCLSCGGILKSATISFGQSLVAEDLDRAYRAARTSELFLALGTSLLVYPVAFLPEIAIEEGARLVVVNAEPTPFDEKAHAILRGRAEDLVPALEELV